jgi:hypothetical protein
MQRRTRISGQHKKSKNMGHQENLEKEQDRSEDVSDKDEDSKLPAQLRPEGQETNERPLFDPSSLSMPESDEQWFRGSLDSTDDQQESTVVASLSGTQQNPQIASQYQDQNSYRMTMPINIQPPPAEVLPMMINPYGAALFLNPMGSNALQSQHHLQQAVIQQAASNLIASMMLPEAATLAPSTSGIPPPAMPGFSVSRQQLSFPGYVHKPPPQPTQQTRASEAASSSSALIDNFSPAALTNRSAVPLYLDYDEETLNEYQCILRKQIELFETKEEDIAISAQGRNQPIFIGQIGIRCR